MAYNATALKMFVEKAIKEANEAAQNVFDKYQKEFEDRVKAQLRPGDRLITGMGTATIVKPNGEHVDNNIVVLLSQMQYPYEELNACFSTPDIIK